VSYPLLRVDSAFMALEEDVYFTTPDLNQAYLQIEFEKQSKELTSFVTNDCLYQYKRILFG